MVENILTAIAVLLYSVVAVFGIAIGWLVYVSIGWMVKKC